MPNRPALLAIALKGFAPAFLAVLLFARFDALERARQFIAERNLLRARSEIEHVLAVDSANSQAHLLLGAVLIDLGEYATAIDHLRKSPDRRLLARACLLAGRTAEAQSILELLVESKPEDGDAWSLLGRLHENSGRPRTALPALRRALEINRTDVLARVALANAHYSLGNDSEAAAEFEHACRRNQEAPRAVAQAHASYAIFLLRQNRLDQAAAQVRLASALEKQDPLTLEAEQALSARKRSVDIAPSGASHARDPVFEEVARSSGIRFTVDNSATPAKHQIETMAGGVAVLDFNNDGLLDIYFTNGAEIPSLRKSSSRFWNRLYRNDGNFRFTDVTERAGVAGRGYNIAAAAADFDNDGDTDLFVAGVNGNILYRNQRDGSFVDVTKDAGLAHPHPRYGIMWGIHGTWLDYDRDGWLDLMVVNYCQWNVAKEPDCSEGGPAVRSYCHPRYYKPLPNQLFRNNRDGTFTDVSESTGLARHLGKGMGAAVADFNRDGWPDIFVANDTEPNLLFRSDNGRTFTEVGLENGVALNQFGKALSSMGADFRDIDNDGWPDIFVTTLSNEGFLLFRNRKGSFDDFSDQSRLTSLSLPWSGWSNMAADLNNDGWKDLFAVNGHSIDNIELFQNREYKQPNLLLVQSAPLHFRSAHHTAWERKAAYRGAAFADFDNDGRLDLVVSALNQPALLLRNVTPGAHSISLHLTGRRSNRSGLGAVVTAELDDGRTLTNSASTSVGYASSSDPRVHFGLGEARVVRLSVEWPSGARQRIDRPDRDRVAHVTEEEHVPAHTSTSSSQDGRD
jgi:enediyne biosynthesis protein E4